VAAKPRPRDFKFTDEHANVVLELGKLGSSQKNMYAAIGISKATAARLKKEDPNFDEIMSLATTHGQAYWENMILANVENKAFNSRIAELALKGQYPDDYRERYDVKADVKQEVTIDFQASVNDLLKQLKEAQD
jgi:hypothetical protein